MNRKLYQQKIEFLKNQTEYLCNSDFKKELPDMIDRIFLDKYQEHLGTKYTSYKRLWEIFKRFLNENFDMIHDPLFYNDLHIQRYKDSSITKRREKFVKNYKWEISKNKTWSSSPYQKQLLMLARTYIGYSDKYKNYDIWKSIISTHNRLKNEKVI